MWCFGGYRGPLRPRSLQHFDGGALIGTADDRVAAEHRRRFPSAHRHNNRLWYARRAQRLGRERRMSWGINPSYYKEAILNPVLPTALTKRKRLRTRSRSSE